MNGGRKNNQKWQVLCQNIEPRTEKSISSKASGQISRYSPKKTPLKSPQNLINLRSLKNREITPLQISSRAIKFSQKQETRKQQKSLLVQPVSLKYMNQRNNSIDHEYLDKAHKSKKQRSETDMIVDLNTMSKEQNMLDQPLSLKQEMENVPKPFMLSRFDTFSQNAQLQSILRESQQKHQYLEPEDLVKIQYKKEIQEYHHKNGVQMSHKFQLGVEKIFQNCVAGLNILEEEMNTQRAQVYQILQEKYKLFTEFRQKLLKIFAKKQKQIKKLENRKILESYLPQQQPQQTPRNTLMRVTSQRVFNRIQRDHCEQNVNLTEREPSAHGRSVQSRGDSVYKKNFDRIFNTINKLKSELSDDQVELKNRLGQISNDKNFQHDNKNSHQNHINQINRIYTNPNIDINQRINLLKNMNITNSRQNYALKNSGRLQDRQEPRNNSHQLLSDRKYTGNNIYLQEWRNKLERFKI